MTTLTLLLLSITAIILGAFWLITRECDLMDSQVDILRKNKEILNLRNENQALQDRVFELETQKRDLTSTLLIERYRESDKGWTYEWLQ